VPPYAAVSTSVTLARETAGGDAARFVNATLRRIAAQAPGPAPAGPSHPEWLLLRWRARFGPDETNRLVDWNDSRPALTLQPARWPREELAARLREAGLVLDDAPFGAGLRVTGASRPTTLPGFDAGAFIVQDAGPAMVCRFAAIPRGATVYDACAAPGGKAIVLARDGAVVVAGDAQRARVTRLAETVRRCDDRVTVTAADILQAPFAPAAFDAVLVDAPCTATGVMARHPDARWRLSERAIQRAAERQKTLLTRAADLVRPGGVLVYATCSLEPEENEGVVNALLEMRSDYQREPVRDVVPGELITPVGDLAILPQRHGVDGAYAARLVRSS